MAKGKSSKQGQTSAKRTAHKATKPMQKGASKGRQEALMAKISENPFEKQGTGKKKHDVFNRRVKGEGRNVAKARSEAIDRRKRTLLVDYQASKKVNSFEDKRFGEADPALPLDEKMWARYQKEITRSSRSGRNTAFNLDDDEDGDEGGGLDLLTHRGKLLGAGGGTYEGSDNEEDGGNLDAEIVDRLHFGGGKGNGADNGHYGERKTHKEIMDEIIMKSKTHKAEKAKAKDEQEDVREKLDADFGDFLGLLDRRPTKADGNKDRPKLDDFDKITRELGFEARAQASDRTKTPEEIAKVERERLEELEKKRLARMRGENSDDEDSKATSRRGRQRNDDELGDDFALEDPASDELSKVSPLVNGADKSASGRKKRKREEEQEQELEEGSGESSGESSEEKGSGEENSDSGEESSGEESSGNEEGSEELEDPLDEKVDEEKLKMKKIDRKAAAKEIPYLLPCPGTMENFLELLAEHARSAQDVNTIVERILKCHSIKLSHSNKEKMHGFYHVLLQRYRRLGDQLTTHAQGGGDGMDKREQLDCIAKALFEITTDSPEAAGSLWHRTIGSMQKKLAKELRDRGQGIDSTNAPCWPSLGNRLLLKLLGDIFPTTDFRHPVTTPATLLLGQYISQCPVQCSADLSAGMFICATQLQFTCGAGRLAPEASAFLTGVLGLYAPRINESEEKKIAENKKSDKKGKKKKGSKKEVPQERVEHAVVTRLSSAEPFPEVVNLQCLPALVDPPLGWLRASAAYTSGTDSSSGSPGPLDVLSGYFDDVAASAEELSEFSRNCLGAVYALLTKAVRSLRNCQGLPELLEPLRAMLSYVRPTDYPALPRALQERHLALQEEVASVTAASLSTRVPLTWQLSGIKTIKALAPKFEESYSFRKDLGVDSSTAQVKLLKRQLKRERKGAVRELKRDAGFLEDVKNKEKDERDQERKKTLRANLTWLETEQATWNQQVGKKSTRKLIAGGGSAIVKKPKIGRV